MNQNKLIWWMGGIPLLVAVLILVILVLEPEKEGIARAMAAKSVALAVQSPEELSAWQREYGSSRFDAETVRQWYVPYLDYLYEYGFLSEETTPADEEHAEGFLTYGEAAQLAEAVSPDLKKQVALTGKNREKPFPEEAWWRLYEKLLEEADGQQAVRKETVLFYATPDTLPGTPAWTAHTNLGRLTFYGLAVDRYVDHQVLAWVRGGEIIHICEDQGAEVEYRNVWLAGGNETGLRVYVGDITREISFRKTYKGVEKLVGNLADIRLKDGKITKVSVKNERIRGKVLSVQEDAIEIEGYGTVPLDDEFKVLKIYGELKRQTLDDILVGYDMQEFVAANGKICAVLTVRDFEADQIRVLVMSQDFGGLYHDRVTLYCPDAMIMVQGEQETPVEAGAVLEFAHGEEAFASGRMIFTAPEGQEITVRSLNRAQGNPAYAGRLELIDTDQGLVLINELYLEDYLTKVVPSEMPASYEMEALKAQAVCARTYAYMQIQSNTYSEYGAHVDDSTNFQVYNNIQTDAKTTQAVEETYGKLLFYEGKPISAYYYSTSCGTTTDGSVWGGDGSGTPYLKAVTLQPGRRTVEFASEEEFASFIKDQDMTAYDSEYPFFRWNTTTDGEILASHISGVGTVQSVEITERGPGGVAKSMLVVGSDGEKTITGQNAIRAALGDTSLTINRKDGKTSTGWSSLPSGFLTVEAAGNHAEGVPAFRIYGGGFGHGAGMSQNGAQGMAKSGMGYEEILRFFYDGVTMEEMK